MRRSIFILFTLFFLPSFSSVNKEEVLFNLKLEDAGVHQLYLDMELDRQRVSYAAFKEAMTGYNAVKGKKKEIVTLIDFTKPSTQKRLFVMDIRNRKLLYASLVSHGKNSGGLYATSFSNKSGSHKSSLGFFLTKHTYNGRNGYSMVLEGLEKGINDQARKRAIVVHGAPYSNPSVIRTTGKLGRSYGCPALPQKISSDIIDVIKDGSLLYIYADSQRYLAASRILNRKGIS